MICSTARAAPSAIPGPNDARSPDKGIRDAKINGSLAGAGAAVVVGASVVAGASVVSTSTTASSLPPSLPPQAAATSAKIAIKAKALRFFIYNFLSVTEIKKTYLFVGILKQ